MVIFFLYLICAIAIGTGLYGLIVNKYMRTSFRWIAVFLLSAGLIQLAAYFSVLIFKTNLLLYNIATLFYYIVIYLVFAHFTRSKTISKINNILFLIGGIAILALVAFAINTNSLSIAAITISGFVFSVASMVYLLDLIRTPGSQSPFKTGKIYALGGILLYYSATIFFWASKKISASMNYNIPRESLIRAEYINQVMIIIFYVILLISLVVEKKDFVKDEF